MRYLLAVLLWVGYCALHSYLISIRFTNFLSRHLKRYYAFYRLFYVIISIALFIPLLKWTGHMKGPVLFEYGEILTNIRHLLFAGSLLIFFWAFFINYDSWSFWGIRQIMEFGKNASRDPVNTIKMNGLLGMTRHPMYFALIIFLWCGIFTLMDIVVNLVLTAYILVGTLLEERKLVLEFGDAYRQYQKKVPMLFPRISLRARPPASV